MRLISLVIACLLSAQQPLETNSPAQQTASMESPTLAANDGSPTNEGSATNEGLPADSPLVTPEGLVDRAISSAAADEIPGEPLSLLAALSNVQGQAERMGVVHAYWQATLALAKYGVALDENRRLTELNSGTSPATSVGAVETSRLAAIDAQHRLARTARLPQSIQLSIPSDRPHVRTYETRFEQIFSSSVLKERLRLIDRKLPLRLQVIDARVLAVQAAEDTLIALTDSYQKSEADLTTVTAAVEELARQRREFLEAVCDYNHEIADYALNIAGQEVTGLQLVATLIDVDRKPAIEPRRGGATEMHRQADVQQAEFIAPLDTDRKELLEPTLAVEEPPRTILPPAADNERPAASLPPRQTTAAETAADQKETSTPEPLPKTARAPETAQAPEGDLENGQTGGNHSEPTLPNDGSPAPNRFSTRLPLIPVERKALKMPQDNALPTSQYADLTDVEPAIQAGQLVADLFPALEGTFADCQLVGLRECLADRPMEDCPDVIDAYWLARLRAGEYQTYLSRASQLAELLPMALDHLSEPLGAVDMLRLEATRRSSDADVLEAQTRLLDAQYELTLAAKHPLDSSWLLPRTSPRCGPYHPLKLDTQPKSLSESWPIRRLAVTIPTMSEVVSSRAGAVIAADAARFDAVGQFANGTLGVNQAMDEIHKQSRHSLAFLDAVTVYNQSIAEYEVRTNSGTAADIAERLLAPVAPQ